VTVEQSPWSVPIEPCVDPAPRLRRTLSLTDLVLYGVIAVSPVAPLATFGLLSERGHGHVVTAILIAMVAMVFTAISYGRMARAYPSAGSAYTYVSSELHSSLGLVTGWGILLDYTLGPLICTVWCAEQSHEFAPSVPTFVFRVLYVACFSVLNIQGIRSSARLNFGMTACMSGVVVVVLVAAAHYILADGPHDIAFFVRPFYDPATFTGGGLLRSTAVAVTTYIGFDAITTLSEEAKNPRRNVLLATVLTCVVIGILSAVEVYVGQLVWPATDRFSDVDRAYVLLAGRAWRPLLSIMGLTLIAGYFAAGMAAHLGAARLLYAMGRSNALPRSFFGSIDPEHHIPRNNVLFVGAVVLTGGFFVSFALAAEMMNFGALIAFMGVNAAAFLRYFVRASRKTLWNFIPPVLGFLICLALWWNLGKAAKELGSLWMLAGIVYCVWRTRSCVRA
jgi:putrescine importer